MGGVLGLNLLGVYSFVFLVRIVVHFGRYLHHCAVSTCRLQSRCALEYSLLLQHILLYSAYVVH